MVNMEQGEHLMTGHSKARRHGDEYHCAACGKQWDVNDPDPPTGWRESRAGEKAIGEIRRLLSDRNKR